MPSSAAFSLTPALNLHGNQRSMLVRLNTPSTDKPARKASAIYQIRSAPVFQLAADFSQCFRVVEAHFRIEAGRAHFEPRSSAGIPAACGQSPSLHPNFIWVVRQSFAQQFLS